MNEPTRLLQQPGTNASTLELLRAIEAPAAAPPAVQAALVKDLSGLVAGSALKVGATAVWLKLTAAGLAALGIGGAVYWSRSGPQRAAPSLVAPRLPASTVAPPKREPPPAPDAALPAVSSALPAEPVKALGSLAPRDSLAAEEALLEAARQLLAASPARALGLLQKHKSQFPRGQLSAERMYLSVDALQRLGNGAAAQREAAALTKHYPNSVYARRAPLLLASPQRP
jgi:hypothetical protein